MKEIHYTEAAEQELVAFKAHQQQLLEELISEQKLIFGDDILEITASDIKDVSQYFHAYRPKSQRFILSYLVTRIYIVIGFIMMIGAFLYPQIQTIFIENRIQAAIFLMGLSMAGAGWLFNLWIKIRQKRIVEEENRYFNIERDRMR